MHSFIFNSETGEIERSVPKVPWYRVFVFLAAFIFIAVAAWEIYWRNQGFEPDIDNTLNHWAEHRKRVEAAGKNVTVIAGSSRALFDFDLSTWKRITGQEQVIQLAEEGASPLPIVQDIVENTRFAGTLVISVAPDLFFYCENNETALNHGWAKRHVSYYQNWSPAQRMEHALALVVEPQLAFVDESALTLGKLLLQIPFKNRNDLMLGSEPVPKLANYKRTREAKMWNRVVTDTAYQRHVRGLWLGFNSRENRLMLDQPYQEAKQRAFEGVFRKLKPDERMRETQRDSFYNQIKIWVDTLKNRGGQVIFIRPPSSGMYLQMENHNYPREEHWDELLRRVNCPGVYFEDYPQLQGFELPEWSHLRADQTPAFTEALVKIVQEKLAPR